MAVSLVAMNEMILASASAGRLGTLQRAGVHPRVVVSSVDEQAVIAAIEAGGGPLSAREVALVLARAKCLDVNAALTDGDDADIVLGCDSVLEFHGAVHGKPGTAEEARARWRAMRGSAGVLHSGHWLIDRRDRQSPAELGDVASTTVHFADLDDAEIEAYVATGEPLHVAGGFTVDGLGGPYVRSIEGDYHAVVGVSLPMLRELLRQIGVTWHDLRG